MAAIVAGAGAPVLLLHGQGGRGDTWDLQIEALARGHRVVAPDLHGRGAAAPTTMAGLAAEVAGLCREMSLGPCAVIGHSLGGMVALQLALDAPELVSRLAIVNSAALGGSWGAGLRRGLLRLFLRVRGMEAFARLNAGLHFPGAEQGALRRRLVEVMGACDRRDYVAAQAAVDAFDVRARLGEIACPVLVVHSQQDIIPLADKTAIVEGVRRGRLVTIAGSRHVPLWDQPDALNTSLLEFLAEP